MKLFLKLFIVIGNTKRELATFTKFWVKIFFFDINDLKLFPIDLMMNAYIIGRIFHLALKKILVLTCRALVRMIPMILKISDSSYSSSPQTFLRKLIILTWNISWNSGSLFLSSSWSMSKFSRRHMTGLFFLSSKPLNGAIQQYSGEFLLLPSTIPLLVK